MENFIYKAGLIQITVLYRNQNIKRIGIVGDGEQGHGKNDWKRQKLSYALHGNVFIGVIFVVVGISLALPRPHGITFLSRRLQVASKSQTQLCNQHL